MKTLDIITNVSEVVQGMIHNVGLENLLEHIQYMDMRLVL